jgi:hypothetical protein
MIVNFYEKLCVNQFNLILNNQNLIFFHNFLNYFLILIFLGIKFIFIIVSFDLLNLLNFLLNKFCQLKIMIN